MVPYDQDLAEAFGINNRATFSTFYTILHDLAAGGQCNANNVNQDNAAQYNNQDGNYNQDGYYDQDGNYNQDGDQDNEDQEAEEDGEDQDADDQDDAEDNEDNEGEQEDGGEGRLRRRLEDAQDQDAQDQDAQDQNAQGQQGYSVANVVRNCGSVFQAYGIDLSNVDMDEDNDELDEALKTLSINIQIEMALESGALDNYNYNFANNDQDGGDDDQGNNGQGYYSVLQILGSTRTISTMTTSTKSRPRLPSNRAPSMNTFRTMPPLDRTSTIGKRSSRASSTPSSVLRTSTSMTSMTT